MRSFWFDPYLWIHLAGAAAVPIWLEICFLGLALGDPLLPPGLEIFLVAAVGVVPTLWMQWRRPFYIFSLLVVALKAGALTADQRRLLRFFKSFQTKVLALVVPVMLTYLLWLLYQAAPLATDTLATLPIPQWHLLGLLVAAIAFLLANLFLQVPVSVLRVMLASEQAVAQADPYPIDQISLNFTSIGFEVARILPPIEVAPPSPPAPLTPPAGADLGAAEASLDEADPSEGDEPTIDDAALSAGESNQGVAEEVTETGAPETEAPKTEAPETEATETEVTETEVTETEVAETEATETEATETEATETEVTETGVSETEVPETEATETGATETGATETEAPETEATETEVVDAGAAAPNDIEAIAAEADDPGNTTTVEVAFDEAEPEFEKVPPAAEVTEMTDEPEAIAPDHQSTADEAPKSVPSEPMPDNPTQGN